MPSHFKSFAEFYPFYLSEHRNPTCRRLHFMGTFLIILTLIVMLVIREWKLILITPLLGYGFAWIGHFFFERNKPATFKHPFYSLTGDFVMFWEMTKKGLGSRV